MAVATVFGAGLLLAQTTSGHAQQAAATIASPEAATPEDVARADLKREIRIRRLHDSLKITAEQEALWKPVATAMRDNDKEFRSGLRSNTPDSKASTAVDTLKVFQIVADHHASGLKNFIPAFSALYESLPPDQQKRADKVFRTNSR